MFLHTRTQVAVFGIVAAMLGSGAVPYGQLSSNPYRVNTGWDKPQGRKIGVASGIRMDRDGRHMWILDRCGAWAISCTTSETTRQLPGCIKDH